MDAYTKSAFAALAQQDKRAMILDMALDFAGMTRVLSKGSNPRIIEQLERLFTKMESVRDQSEYDRLHAEFCSWFIQNICVAEKKLKSGRIIPERKSSYGHAAKVLDITAKVYVYYCAQPSPEVAQRLVPLLHGALDNQILGHLKRRFSDAGIKSTSIMDTDRDEYEQLQSLVRKGIQQDFNSEIHPVQYDDIMFRRLNRSAD